MWNSIRESNQVLEEIAVVEMNPDSEIPADLIAKLNVYISK